MIKIVKLPEERIAVVIGKAGKTRKYLEKITDTTIEVKDEGKISGESLEVMIAENIIKGIGRGFSPKNAINLLDDENTMLMKYLPKNTKVLKRLRSRLIGTKGKSRRNLEMLTKTKISIYGRTIGIIGTHDNVKLAEEAIDKIIEGSPHNHVYAYLESKKR